MKLIIVIVVILLPMFYAEHKEQNLINQLNEFFNFDHNILLLDSSADIGRYFDTGHKVEFTPRSLRVFNNLKRNLTRLATLTEIKSKNTLLIVDCRGSNLKENTNLLNEVIRLQRRQINMKIGIFFSQVASSEDVKKLFQWFWRNKIIYVFAVTYMYPEVERTSTAEPLFNIFTFNPFGRFNVTTCESFDNLFLSQRTNFQRHPLRLLYGYSKRRSDRLTWYQIIRHLNSTYSYYKARGTQNFTEAFYHRVDVIPKVSIQSHVQYFKMYPISFGKTIILVPEALPYDKFSAYLMIITSESIYAYFLITIVSAIVLLTFVRYIKHKKFLLLQSLTDVIYLLMNDNADITYQKLSRIEICLILPLTFVGFIFVNVVLSQLQSHLTKPVIQPQIDNIDDIYKSTLPIWLSQVMNRTFDALRSVTNRSVDQYDWCKRLTLVEDGPIFREMRLYNRSMIFFTHERHWQTLLKLQKQLNIKGFHVAHTHIEIFFLSFILHPNFPFAERVNEIMSWILAAGLYDLWSLDDKEDGEKNILDKELEILKNREETYVESFSIPVFIYYLWLASIIVFTIEVIWGKKRFSSKNCIFRVRTLWTSTWLNNQLDRIPIRNIMLINKFNRR